MFPRYIFSRAAKDKVGNSKVIQAFKDTYDYVIGTYSNALSASSVGMYVFALFFGVGPYRYMSISVHRGGPLRYMSTSVQ